MDKIGSYKLIHRVGEGSYGEVYQAEKAGQFYALKLYKKGAPREVLREGAVLRELNHPALIHFVEEDLKKQPPFLVTEWVEGPSLEEAPPPSDFKTLLHVTSAVLKGLQALHEKGYVHGDLKCRHVLLGPQGVKLIDLGLSRSMTPSEPTAAGTLAYLAPEVFFGRPLGPQSDFYALGMVLYRWLNGTYPFQTQSVSQAIRWHLFEHLLHPIPRQGGIPLEFGDFILTLLSKNPLDRPSQALKALIFLDEKFGLEGGPISASVEGPREEQEEGFELHGEAIRFYEQKKELNEEEKLVLAELYYRQGHLSQALEVLKPMNDPQSNILKTKVLTRMGHFQEAKRWIHSVTPDLYRLSLKESLAFFNAQGVLDFYLGRVGDSLVSFASAEKLAQGMGEKAALAPIYNNLANGLLEKGENLLAEKYFIRSIELAREAGDRIHEGMFQMSLGYFFHRHQRYSEALAAYNESLEILEKVGQKSEKARVLLNRANLFLKLGKLAEARDDLRIAQKIFRSRSLDYLSAYSLLIEGEIFQKDRVWADALACFEKAEDQLTKLARPTDVLYARLHQAETLLEMGILPKARSILHRLGEEPQVLQQDSLAGHYFFLKARLGMASGESLPSISKEIERSEHHLEKAEDRDTLKILHVTWDQYLKSTGKGRPHESPSLEIDHSPLLLSSTPPAEIQNFFERERTKILEELVGELQLNVLVEKILDRMIVLTGAERGFILMNEGAIPRVAASRNLDRETLGEGQNEISRSIAFDVLKSGEALVTVDALLDERFSVTASIHHLKLRSILCLPFKKGQEVMGAIYLDDRRRSRAFSPDWVQGLSPFADLMGQVLSNAHRYQEIKKDLETTRKKLEAAQSDLQRKYEYRSLIGSHPKMNEVFQILDRVTDVEVPVLILGESGAGKELAAKAIHFHGPRAKLPFVSFNCQAIPEGLFESELFGHVRGAFTGAVSDRAGLLEMAQGGTLFLDEIGDMPSSLQGKLLRVLQEGKYRPVGDKEEKTANCRILAATHRDLHQLISQGKFREDLFFRLNVVEIRLPPLRDRMEDLPLLVDHFLGQFAQRHGGKKNKVSPEAMALLAGYSWPGNVRELENTLMNACVFALGDLITPEAFRYKRELWGEKGEAGNRKQETGEEKAFSVMSSRPPASSFRQMMRNFEKQLIGEALNEANGNITKASLRLKMARPQLSRMMKKFQIKK